MKDPAEPEGATARYWNENLDPFGHRPAFLQDSARAWRMALRTYDGPDTACAASFLGDLRAKRLLELASGLGFGAVWLALQGAEVTGMDISRERCRTAEMMRARCFPACSAVFRCGDAADTGLEAGSYDLVYARDVLMYTEPARVVAECRRVLKPGGRAVFNEALRGNPLVSAFRRLLSDRGHRRVVRYLRAADLTALGGGLEFRQCRHFYLFSWTAFALLYSLRSEKAYRLALQILDPLDRTVLSSLPGTNRWAWRGVAMYRKE